ncbi:hypothetical protein PB1_16554 [Bacillus methanolicus PB1]|uniref:Glycosyltransferase RgtA/B/C/D-like domain-containing protein n=1 Tax=Bacillus methanolicus PB1 TaxID=997296 RepID=I3DY65_BACMT|nr:hypothetical protein [Bacillus methanolicus]EIJ79186.1 hypothetical protein PB1_16554 [Bacillus methanolicus PB1]
MKKNNKFACKTNLFTTFIQIISLLAISFLLGFQFKYTNSFASTWDQVDFARGLDMYNIMAMQPHFPGYPYFILGGKILHLWIENPAEALTVFNILFFSSALIPIYLIGRQYLKREYSLLMTAILYTGSYCLTMVNQPMSEGAALSALWWYVYSLKTALKSRHPLSGVLSMFLLSILLGIRLSYFPFSIGIVYFFYRKWKEKHISMKQIFVNTIIAFLFQFVWVLAAAFSEGGIKPFIKLALAFTSGHFQSWGGAVTAVDLNFVERLRIFIIENIFWTGILSRSIILLVFYFLIAILFLFSMKWENVKKDILLKLLFLLGFCYFLWALFAQNIDKPRHILPLAMFILFYLFIVVLAKRNHLVALLCMFILCCQCFLAASLIKEQATLKPAIYKTAKFLNHYKNPFIVYTWEETRVFDYLNVPFSHKRVQTYNVFVHDAGYYSDKEILLTDKVVQGFKQQGIDVEDNIVKVQHFQSNELFDPIYSEITLFKWKNTSGGEHDE